MRKRDALELRPFHLIIIYILVLFSAKQEYHYNYHYGQSHSHYRNQKICRISRLRCGVRQRYIFVQNRCLFGLWLRFFPDSQRRLWCFLIFDHCLWRILILNHRGRSIFITNLRCIVIIILVYSRCCRSSAGFLRRSNFRRCLRFWCGRHLRSRGHLRSH